MRRRDLLNLGGRHRCVQPGGDPLQALLDGNARFVDFESRYQQVSYPPSRGTATALGRLRTGGGAHTRDAAELLTVK